MSSTTSWQRIVIPGSIPMKRSSPSNSPDDLGCLCQSWTFGGRGHCPTSRGGAALRLGDRPRGVDQADVAERLREVAEQFAGLRIDLFGEQSDVVHEGDRVLEHGFGALDLTGLSQRLGEPEGAQQERPFLARQAVDAL